MLSFFLSHLLVALKGLLTFIKLCVAFFILIILEGNFRTFPYVNMHYAFPNNAFNNIVSARKLFYHI